MAIPNVKRFRIVKEDGSDTATVMAVLPKGADVNAYLKSVTARFDWKAHDTAKAAMNKVRVGQQKQKKAK
jgi:ABC-type phosphate/phosphonate transport system substrate-binding protein